MNTNVSEFRCFLCTFIYCLPCLLHRTHNTHFDFLATLVALHFTPVSESVSQWAMGIVSDKRSLELVLEWKAFWLKRLLVAPACGRGSMTKPGIDQLKPRWSSLTATNAPAHNITAVHTIQVYIRQHTCLYICKLHTAQKVADTLQCWVHWMALKHKLIGRRPLRTEAMSRYRWEPQHLRNQCTAVHCSAIHWATTQHFRGPLHCNVV